jgi:hypothetical protein
MSEEFQGLPVAGYQSQSREAVALVNKLKYMEERVLRLLDEIEMDDKPDIRWIKIAHTHIQQGFMAAARSVFKPERIDLPEDAEEIDEDEDN